MRLILLAVAMGCLGSLSCVESGGQEAPGALASPVPAALVAFEGRLVSRNATALRAPQNVIKLRSWSMSSSWIKLVKLAPEESAVKEGDVVASFEFRGKRAQPKVQEEIDRAKADAVDSELRLVAQLESLRTDLSRWEMDARQAKLDTLRGASISVRNQALYEIKHRQALFEVEATKRLIAVHRRKMAAQKVFWGKQIERALAEMERFKRFESLYKVKAPHDGMVRYGWSRRRRRKIQKGDGMPAGFEFAYLALNEEVSVEFFVPEDRVDEIGAGDVVKVLSPVSGVEVEASVAAIERFPQEIGFLRKNDDLPTAREKAYVVRAVFEDAAPEMKAGLEVKVLMR